MAGKLLYYKTMIPEFLQTKLIGISATTDTSETELMIPTDSADHEIILFTELIGAGKIRKGTDVTVVINVSAEGPPPKKYDPLSICVTDKNKVMGVQLRDPSEYVSIAPYQGITGDFGRILTNITEIKSSEKEQNFKPGNWQRWPQFFQMRLKPNPPPKNKGEPFGMAPWGLCTSAANGGISLSYNLGTPLSVEDGIFLVLYRNKHTETYTINMIEVTIYEDGE